MSLDLTQSVQCPQVTDNVTGGDAAATFGRVSFLRAACRTLERQQVLSSCYNPSDASPHLLYFRWSYADFVGPVAGYAAFVTHRRRLAQICVQLEA